MDCYQLADFVLEWEGFPLLPGRWMERFRCPPERGGERLRLRGEIAPLAPYLQAPPVRENGVYAAFDVEGEPLLVYHWGNNRFAFAVWPGRTGPEGEQVCLFDPDMLRQPGLSADWFFGVSGLHSALLRRGAPILHASYIAWRGLGLCFTAPSGTGKSTQAELWRQHAGAEVVNGDRVLLQRRGGRWHAHGYPCCGSSQICLDRTLPLGAVVVLEQGVENALRPLEGGARVRALAAGTEFYFWDQGELDQVFRLAEELAAEVPVVKLTCRPDQGAVEILKDYLEGLYATTVL